MRPRISARDFPTNGRPIRPRSKSEARDRAMHRRAQLDVAGLPPSGPALRIANNRKESRIRP